MTARLPAGESAGREAVRVATSEGGGAMITAIGTAMLELMRENDVTWVMWGDCFMLDSAFANAGSKNDGLFPRQKWQRVLGALGRDERFVKRYMEIDVGWGDKHQKRMVRVFKPVEENQ